jgi:hypothetical protein
MMEIPEAEISSTFRWLPNQSLELILFDNVSGGAGYTAKIYEMKASEILRHARERILECPENCTTSCSKCLRSYSNQYHWDDFRRHDAIRWIDAVLKVKRADPRIQLGAEQIKGEQVNALCDAASHIVLNRERFGDFSGGLDGDDTGRELPIADCFAEWSRINQWIASGKQITIICRQYPQFSDPSLPRARRFSEIILPLVRSGKLRLLLRNEQPTERDDVDEPQATLLDHTSGKATLVYDIGGGGAILDQLWSDELLARDVLASEIDLTDSGPELRPSDLERPDSIKRFNYTSGEERDIARDFSFLSEGKIGRLEITDRYMAAGQRQKDALESFMRSIADLWNEPPSKITFWHGPARDSVDRSNWIRTMDEIISNCQSDGRFENTEFSNQFRGSMRVRNFHDRRVVAHFVNAQSSETTQTNQGRRQRKRRQQNNVNSTRRSVTAELTGGIDLLMYDREETTVFVIDQAGG